MNASVLATADRTCPTERIRSASPPRAWIASIRPAAAVTAIIGLAGMRVLPPGSRTGPNVKELSSNVKTAGDPGLYAGTVTMMATYEQLCPVWGRAVAWREGIQHAAGTDYHAACHEDQGGQA